MAAESLIQRGDLVMSDAGIFWLETDPASGSNQICTLGAGGSGSVRLLSQTLGVRSQVNGYGGGALCAAPDRLYAVEGASQQIVLIRPSRGTHTTLTNDPDACYGGLVWDAAHDRLLAVRESSGEQRLVWMDNGRSGVLHRGEDFYGAPALSASGRQIAWISWRLPDMPWTASTLWHATLRADGSLADARAVAAPAPGCVQQPLFAGETLTVIADYRGWWQPWQWSRQSGWVCLDDLQADGANAPWQLGESHHLMLPGGGWLRLRYRDAIGELWWRGNDRDEPQRLAEEYVDFRGLRLFGGQVCCIARSPDRLDAILSVDPVSGQVHCLAGGERPFKSIELSCPECFLIPPGAAGEPKVSGFYYPPIGREGQIDDARPSALSLVIIAHGGPTSMAYAAINPQIQFLCHQGFAVAEVNYRGSSGFGRAFRTMLAGQWGVLDVEDMERAARHLVRKGKADPRRIAIQGRSAGGYTALMAMVSSDCFAAGVSQFGVSDPARLRQLTHRFESGYLDWLLGPEATNPERWQARSPLVQAHRIRKPMAFFQGGKDPVVVPEQTDTMAAAIRANGQSPLVRRYPDEGHGFRQAANQADMLDQLAGFYHRLLKQS